MIVAMAGNPGWLLADTGKSQATDPEDFALPGTFSSTIAFATEYVFRGISQSDEDVAIQASLDWSHESGLYTGFWSSNVDFPNDSTAQIELNVYGGRSGEYKGVTYDVMVLGYVYPGADRDRDFDFVEFSLALGHRFPWASVNTAVAISPDYFGSSGVGAHVSGGVGVPIPLDFLERYRIAVDTHVGYQDISTGGSYVHWDVGLGGQLLGFDLDLRYVGNDVDSPLDEDDDGVVFSFSRQF